MSKNISLKDGVLLKSTIIRIGGITGWVIGILSALFSEYVSKYRLEIVITFLIILFIYHLYSWNKANKLKSLHLNINGSIIEIMEGDIFGSTNELSEEKELKVIAFNEYFDTQVDDNIISKKSLNGQLIKNILGNNVDELDRSIEKDTHLNSKKCGINKDRKIGKIHKYKIGTILKYHDEYLLTAFSKFNDENKAQLTLAEYIEFLMEFWNEVDRVYASRVVKIPLLGSGITRFNDIGNGISNQELLEHMLWTFKISRIKFNYPAKIKIILRAESLNQINLFKISEMYGNDH